MEQVLEMIDSAIRGPRTGRALDIRQQADHEGDFESDRLDLSRDGWMVCFPGHGTNGDTPEEMGGPVPIALVGHEDLSVDEFVGFVEKLKRNSLDVTSGNVPDATSSLIFDNDSVPMLDLRRVSRYGNLSASAKRFCPDLCELSGRMLDLIDQCISFPQVSGIIDDYKRSGDILLMTDVYQYFMDMKDRLRDGLD